MPDIDDLNESLDSTKHTTEEIKNTLGEITSAFNDAMQSIVERLSKIGKTTGHFDNTLRQIKQTSRSISDFYKNTAGDIGKGTDNLLKRETVQRKILKTINLQNELQGQIKILQEQILVSDGKKADVLREALQVLSEQETTLSRINKLYQDERTNIDTITRKKLQPLIGILKGISKIPIIGDESLINVQRGVDLMENAIRPKEEFGKGMTNWFKILGQGLKGTFEGFGTLFTRFALITGPIMLIVGLVKAIVDGMFQADKLITSISKNLGIQKVLAEQVRNIYRDNLTNVQDIYFTVKNQVEASVLLNDTWGTSNILSKNLLQTQIDLTKNLGLTNDEATNLSRLLIGQNETAQDFLTTVNKQTASINKQRGINLNFIQIFKDIAKLSASTLSNYKNSVPELAKAVAQVKALGLEMSEAEQMSRSLLDWQSSIENELEAELLLGKELNFERARGFALQGKFNEAAQEFYNTTNLTFDTFSDLNVIVKDQLAKSIGLSTDKLAESLLYQKNIKKLSEDQLAILNKSKLSQAEINKFLADRNNPDSINKGLMELTIQEKFNQALEKAKEIFSNFVSGGMLDKLVNILTDIINKIQTLYGGNTKIPARESVQKIEANKDIDDSSKKISKELLGKISKPKSERTWIGNLDENVDRIFAPSANAWKDAVEESFRRVIKRIEGGEKINTELAKNKAIFQEIWNNDYVKQKWGSFTKEAIDETFDKNSETIIKQLNRKDWWAEFQKRTPIKQVMSPEQAGFKKMESKQDDFMVRGDKVIPFRKDDLILGGTDLLGEKNKNNNFDNLKSIENKINSLSESIDRKNLEPKISNENIISKSFDFIKEKLNDLFETQNNIKPEPQKIIKEKEIITNNTITKEIIKEKQVKSDDIFQGKNSNEIIFLLREINNALKQGKTIMMDGQKVGTTIAMGSYKMP